MQLQGSGKQFESLSQFTTFFQKCLQSIHLWQGRTVHGTNTPREGDRCSFPVTMMLYHLDTSGYCFKALLPQVNPHALLVSGETGRRCLHFTMFFYIPQGIMVFIFDWDVIQFSSVQSLSRVRLFVTPRIAVRWASLSIANSQSSPKLTSIESVTPSSHLIFRCPLLLLPPNPSQHQSLFQ